MKERIHYIDVAKGIAILLVVLGHCSATSLGDRSRLFYTIYSFHIPFWFFLSGLLYSSHKSVADYVWGKVKALLLPYLIFSIINAVTYYVLANVHMEGFHQFVRFGGLWFLLALFYVVISYYVIDNAYLRKFKNRVRLMGIISILFLLIGMGLGLVSSQPMHALASMMVCFFFFHIGTLVKPYQRTLLTDKRRTRAAILALGLLCVLLLAFIAPLNSESIDVNYGRYGNKIMFVPFAFLGTLGVSLISLSVRQNKQMEWLGRNSLMILILHIPLWRIFDYCSVSIGLSHYWRLLFSFAFSLLISIILIVPINKYLPELKGQFQFDDARKQ